MTSSKQTPESASLTELTAYWRMPSERATRDLALKLGVRKIAGRYPMLASMQTERLSQ